MVLACPLGVQWRRSAWAFGSQVDILDRGLAVSSIVFLFVAVDRAFSRSTYAREALG